MVNLEKNKEGINKKIKDSRRLLGSIFYLILSIHLWAIPISKFGFGFIFYNEAIDGFLNYPRLIYCISCVFLGFSVTAYRASFKKHEDEQKNKKSPFPDYFTSYLLALLLMALIDFAFFHIFQSTSSYIFYFLSGPVGFILGYRVDEAKNDPLKFFNVLKFK